MKDLINDYDLNTLVNSYNIDNVYEQYKRYEFLHKLNNYIKLKEANVLELGSATGQMTELLSKTVKMVTAVDGSIDFIKIAKNRVKNFENVKFIESYFEELSLAQNFSCLILHHILEHIKDPLFLLSKLNSLLTKEGIIAISVPNANSLSRLLAVKMGLLNSIYDLTENDKKHGHFRVYDWQMLENQISNCGLDIVGRHGLSLKLFSDKQNIEMLDTKIIGEEQIKGLWLLADEIRQYAGAIMIVAKKK